MGQTRFCVTRFQSLIAGEKVSPPGPADGEEPLSFSLAGSFRRRKPPEIDERPRFLSDSLPSGLSKQVFALTLLYNFSLSIMNSYILVWLIVCLEVRCAYCLNYKKLLLHNKVWHCPKSITNSLLLHVLLGLLCCSLFFPRWSCTRKLIYIFSPLTCQKSFFCEWFGFLLLYLLFIFRSRFLSDSLPYGLSKQVFLWHCAIISLCFISFDSFFGSEIHVDCLAKKLLLHQM